jgi:NhaA family Na+:H+ antiporter
MAMRKSTAAVLAMTTYVRMLTSGDDRGRETHRLDRAVDPAYDHVLGLPAGDITLVEYGSYACPYCRAANEEIAKLRDRFGERLRYVFRQRPITGSDIARRAADIAESAPDGASFWDAHVKLMTRSADADRGRPRERRRRDSASTRTRPGARPRARRGGHRECTRERRARDADLLHQRPALRRSLGLRVAVRGVAGLARHRVQSAAVDFASWAPSTGVLLLAMSILAVLIVNSPAGPAFAAFWEAPLGFEFAEARFRMSLTHLGERRPAHDLLPAGGTRDQARVHRGPLANRRWPRFRSRLRSAAWRCPLACTRS